MFLLELARDHVYGCLADLDLASIDDKALGTHPENTVNILKDQGEKGPQSGIVTFMAVEVLHSQVRYPKAENATRKKGRQDPPTLITQRQPYHDLEALLWALVYSRTICNYNSLPKDTDRKEYRQRLFWPLICCSHLNETSCYAELGSFSDQASEWFADQYKRGFFIRRKTLIVKCNKAAEEEEEDCGTFEGEISDNNPLWDSADDEIHNNNNALSKSRPYVRRNSTKSAQKPRGSTPRS